MIYKDYTPSDDNSTGKPNFTPQGMGITGMIPVNLIKSSSFLKITGKTPVKSLLIHPMTEKRGFLTGEIPFIFHK
ncbi:hypothetical protein [Paenibacillus sp. NPDC057934]|uniref:hypothetical protein n=1 Tax=Paenibacillus sp. NPDC057934 TaxID=3346282 RepID=UPI0036DA461A